MLKDAIQECLHCVGDEYNDLQELYDKIIAAVKSLKVEKREAFKPTYNGAWEDGYNYAIDEAVKKLQGGE